MLALRYLRPKRKLVSVITLISVLGVMLGVAVLVIVIAVMSGFDRQLRTKLASYTAHLRIESRDAVQPWFFEVGIGLNAVMPLYQSRDKRFSTRLNFGNHVAVGRRYGEHHAHEWALRIEHFSNAGIRHPNPGENFVQLRWARRF